MEKVKEITYHHKPFEPDWNSDTMVPTTVQEEDKELFELFHSGLITDWRWNEEMSELLIQDCNIPEILLAFAQHPHTSPRALTKIVSHWRNQLCWEAVAKHYNATPLHLELMLLYPNKVHWFKTECAIASAPCINPEVIEELLRRNALVDLHLHYRLPKRYQWQKQKIAGLLLANPNVPEQYHDACHEIRNTLTIMRLTG